MDLTSTQALIGAGVIFTGAVQGLKKIIEKRHKLPGVAYSTLLLGIAFAWCQLSGTIDFRTVDPNEILAAVATVWGTGVFTYQGAKAAKPIPEWLRRDS